MSLGELRSIMVDKDPERIASFGVHFGSSDWEACRQYILSEMKRQDLDEFIEFHDYNVYVMGVSMSLANLGLRDTGVIKRGGCIADKMYFEYEIELMDEYLKLISQCLRYDRRNASVIGGIVRDVESILEAKKRWSKGELNSTGVIMSRDSVRYVARVNHQETHNYTHSNGRPIGGRPDVNRILERITSLSGTSSLGFESAYDGFGVGPIIIRSPFTFECNYVDPMKGVREKKVEVWKRYLSEEL